MTHLIRLINVIFRLLRCGKVNGCLLVTLYLFAGSAYPFSEKNTEGAERKPLGSAVMALNFTDGRAELIAPQLHSKVDIYITGPVARVRVEQTFRNPSEVWAEAVYTFPLPPDSAVDHLQMRIGERIIEGEIQERQVAQKTYKKARQAGQQAALVQQHRANIFSTKVANVPPGEELAVVLEYQQQVIRRGTGYSLHYPMSITPRYTSQQRSDVTPTATNRLSVAQFPMALASNNNATEIWVDLQAGFELDAVESRYHPVSKSRIDDNHWQLRLDPQAHNANADFVIEWQGRELAVPQASVFTQNFGGQEYALLQLVPPQVELEKYRQLRDIVYVIDTSGSMGGESLRQAKRALLWAIARLDIKDHFNIIEFNSDTWSLFDSAREASAKNITSARYFVKNLEARGGTEMRKALDLALCGSCDYDKNTERLRQVLFLTDGAISNEAQLFATIKTKLGNSRLFTVGIGSAPNRYFMRKAAKMGRGIFVHIGKISEVEQKITHLFERIDTPVMNDIQLELEGPNVDISPGLIPDLYFGEPIVVAIKADSLPAQITLHGQRQGEQWQQVVPLSVAAEHGGIHVAWARKKIESLLDDRALQHDVEGRGALRNQVIDIALNHHLVTPFTSLVAVDKRPLRPEFEKLNHQVLSGNVSKGSQFGLARTATGMAGFIGVGCLMLLLGLCFLWLSRRCQQHVKIEAC